MKRKSLHFGLGQNNGSHGPSFPSQRTGQTRERKKKGKKKMDQTRKKRNETKNEKKKSEETREADPE